jgi:TonB family protein
VSVLVLSVIARVKPAWVLSVAVHAGIGGLAYGATGHAAAVAGERPFEVELIESVSEPPPLPVVDPPASDTAPAAAARVATHTHEHAVPHDHDSRPHDPSLRHDGAEAVPVSPDAPAAREEAPPVVSASDPSPPRFVIAMPQERGEARGGHAHDRPGTAHTPPPAAPTVGATISESAVSSPARLVSGGVAAYPPDARAVEAEADVPLEIVVDTSGAVVDARVVKPAGLGFDESAVAAVKRYRFSPALLSGQAVRVRMRWSVQYRLR